MHRYFYCGETMDTGNGGNNNGGNNNGRNGIPPTGPKIYPTGQYTPRRKPNAHHTGQHTTYNRQRLSSSRQRLSGSTTVPTDIGVGSLGIKKFLFSFRGRLSASAYVVSEAALIIVSSMSFFILLPMCAFLPGPIKGLAMLGYVILLLWSCIALTVRRLHDLGHSGWWCLLYLIPFLNALMVIYLGFWKGEAKENLFGAPASSAPLPFAILCYPIYALTAFLNLLPAANIIPGIDKIPGVRYLMPSSDIKDAKDVQQFVDAMPGIVHSEMDKDNIKQSLALILQQGRMIAAGGFITENRILINGIHLGSSVQNGLAQQQKLLVKSLDKETHVTKFVASAPARQWYVFEVAQPIGKPGFLDDDNRNALTAIGAFK